jgi:serine/threonine-protein kinase
MSAEPSDVRAAGVGEGDLLAGKYRVDRVLGVGGMGLVVAAHHIDLDERVAIKFLLPDAVNNPVAVARFDREARAAVKIRSEHVARVVDVGKLDNGAPYIVMEYLDGRDLADWLVKQGPLPAEQAVEFVLQACEAIAEAHALGIIHRDLKPANLYCIRRPDGALSIKVLDFGISKATALGGAMGMTQTQTVIGSPLYMSPEQLESSKGVDARTDIWALGVILFELCTGRVPFMGEGIAELVLRIVTWPAPRLEGPLPVPAGLDAIIHRCLAKDRQARYANVSELANDLMAFAPARARLSVERIAGVMSGAGIPTGPGFRPLPPGGGHVAGGTGGVGGPSPMAATRPASPPQPLPALTDGAWGQTGGRAPPASASRMAVILGGAVMLALISAAAGVVVARKGATPVATGAAPTVSAIASTAPVTSPPAPSSTAMVAVAAAASSAPAAASPGPAAADPTDGSAPAAVATRPAISAAHGPAVATPPKPEAKPTCDPPYFLDAVGHRRYKPECL